MSKSVLSSCLRCLALAAVVFAVSACSPEEYGVCSIPKSSASIASACGFAQAPEGATQEEIKAIEDANKVASCAIDFIFDCDSLLCGVFRGSDAFCTYRCRPPKCNGSNGDYKSTGVYGCDCDARGCKDECPGTATCVEWVPGTAEYYCLPSGLEYNSNSSAE